MKKISYAILIFVWMSTVLSADVLNDFINQQVTIEAQLLDQNISLDEKIVLQEAQEKMYKTFFFEYSTEKSLHVKEHNPNYTKVKRLKLRLRNNKYLGYTNAVKRDEIILNSYALRQDIRTFLHTVLRQTDEASIDIFKKQVNQTVLTFYEKYHPLDSKKYLFTDINESSTIINDLKQALKENISLQNVINAFTSALLENQLNIYRTARIADSRFFSVLNTINKSPYSVTLNTYLKPMHLDAAKITLVIFVILFILISIKILGYIINYFLHHYKLKEDDIRYIHAHISSLFKLLASLIIVHLIVIAFVGIDDQGINISKFFGIVYVILIALLSYRINNTIAYLKIESMKKSKILKNEVINLSLKVINSFTILIALLLILKILGIDLTALLSGLGILGAALAFAAKDSIANVFGSISILVGDIFEQGDWIETKDINGTVVEIGLRGTTVRTFDNALISIPNFELTNSGIKNWSRRRIGRRIKMKLSLTYESDFGDIKEAILNIREMLKEHKGIANQRTKYIDGYRQDRLVSSEDFQGIKRTTLVYMDTFSDSSIDILVYCFSQTVVWDEWLEVKEDVMFKIANILEKNNLEFAYPTMMLHQAKEED